MKLLVFFTLLTLSCAQEQLPPKKQIKRSYVCPPNFVRLSHRCYYFSKEKATWLEAFFRCQDMYSNLAIIKNANQDKLIRKTLSKRTLEPLERWLGGQYDWKQMQWKWAAPGKPLTYTGFYSTEDVDKEKLKWQCIIIDPTLQYRWNTRSCFEQKHYICQTKIKIVNNKQKRKLQRQYKVNKYNKLNEIPVPNIPEQLQQNSTYLKMHRPISFKLEINNDLTRQFAYKPKPKKKRINKKYNRNRKQKFLNKKRQFSNSTVINDFSKVNKTEYFEGPNVIINDGVNRRRRNRGKDDEDTKDNNIDFEHIKWRTYRKEVNTTNPLYPKPIVEEYYYTKES